MNSPDYSKGVMLALYPDADKAKELALDKEGAEKAETLHVTLAFIGERGEDGVPDKDYWAELHDAAKEVAKRHPPVEAGINGLGQFPEGDNGTPYVGIIGSKTIHPLQQDLVNTLKGKGVEASDKFPFVPHMTFAYLDEGEEFPNHLDRQDLTFNHLVVKNGDVTHKFEFEGTPPPKQEPKEARNGTWDRDTEIAWKLGKSVTGMLYYREEGHHIFHIYDEDKSDKTVCGNDLPETGDIWVDTPPRKHICPLCQAWHDNKIKKNFEEDREEDIAESKEKYPPKPLEELHKPDHEYVGNIGDIQYHIAGCTCGWASNVRSEQAANNAWQRHFDTLNDPGRREKAGEPHYVHPAPKTKRWGKIAAEFEPQDRQWMTGGCGDYARALHTRYPHLQFGLHVREKPAEGEGWGDAIHIFTHDDKNAYDATGIHPLPYKFHNFHEWYGLGQGDAESMLETGYDDNEALEHWDQWHGRDKGFDIAKQGAWMDQVSRPYQDEAIADPNDSMEPVMPPLYQGNFGVWPDDMVEENVRTTHPVDVFSGPKTGKWEPGLPEGHHKEIEKIRNLAYDDKDPQLYPAFHDHLLRCGEIAQGIERNLGHKAESGLYIGPEIETDSSVDRDDPLDWVESGYGYDHMWNRTKDGTIIDAASDQFNPHGQAVRVIPPHDPRQKHYMSYDENEDTYHIGPKEASLHE